MKLVHQWDDGGYPIATAIMTPDTICAVSTGVSRSGDEYSVTCKQPWVQTDDLYILFREDGQGGTAVLVCTSLADAQAGSNAIANVTDLVMDVTTPQELVLHRVGTSEPNLEGFRVVLLPNPGFSNPLLSVYKAPKHTDAAIELTTCDAVIAALEGNTGPGGSLENVAIHACGAPVPATPLPEDLENVRPEIFVLAGPTTRVGLTTDEATKFQSIDMIVRAYAVLDEESAFRRCRGVVAAALSIATDEDVSGIAFHSRILSSPLPERKVVESSIYYETRLQLQMNLLTKE